MARRDEDDEGFDVGVVMCLKDTGQALLCRMISSDGPMKYGQEFWVPQSQVHDNSPVYEQGDTGKLIVTSWFASKEGWSDE